MNGEELIDSINVCAAIACNKCSRVDVNIEHYNDIPFCADGFSEDGWKEVDGLVICPDCINKLNHDEKEES